MFIRNRKAQSTAEYAIVIGLVIAAAVAMQVYVKRGVQGKIKDATDYVDSDAGTVVGTTSQYEPYYLGSNMTATRNASSTENVATGGGVGRTTNEASSRTGTQNITAAENQ
jgi:uncharacterized protein (UPF0333 family)